MKRLTLLFLFCAGCTPQNGDLLCLGDSIRIGYTRHLVCSSPAVNCGSTVNGLYGIENLQWTEGRHWKVIVFNAGLHDIQTDVFPDRYAANLRKIVGVLRPQCDRLYFCSTTPGRDGSPFCAPARVFEYNRAALGVMASEHVPVIDLFGLCMAHREWWKSDYDIHYTEAGYKAMAEYVKHALTP